MVNRLAEEEGPAGGEGGGKQVGNRFSRPGRHRLERNTGKRSRTQLTFQRPATPFTPFEWNFSDHRRGNRSICHFGFRGTWPHLTSKTLDLVQSTSMQFTFFLIFFFFSNRLLLRRWNVTGESTLLLSIHFLIDLQLDVEFNSTQRNPNKVADWNSMAGVNRVEEQMECCSKQIESKVRVDDDWMKLD